MSVFQRMLGSALPCNVLELLDIRPMPLAGPAHDALVQAAAQRYPDVLCKLGVSHLGRQELGLARLRLQEAVAVKPSFVRARLALAGVLDLLADHRAAAEHLACALDLLPAADPQTRYGILCAAAFCLERVGDWQAAVGRYRQALALGESDLFAHHRMTAICLAQNMFSEAVEHHRAILEQQPQEQAVRISLAHVLQHMGRHQEAVWEYEKALCLEPDGWELQVELAEELARMGNTDEAIEHLGELVSRQPQFPDLRLRLANLHAARGDDDKACDEFARALALHPDYLECRIALARHELRMGRTHSAHEHFQRAVGTNNQNVEAYAGLAATLSRMGETARARETLASAVGIAGNADRLLAQIGALEIQDDVAALMNDDAPAAPSPKSGEAAAKAGEAVAKSGEAAAPEAQAVHEGISAEWVERQVAQLEAALAEHPNWTDLRVRCGMLHRMNKQPLLAIAALEHATRDNPGLVEAWVQLGLTRQSMGDIEGALQALSRASDLEPAWAELHYRVGLIYCGQMEFDLAVERLEMAMELQPGGSDFHRQLWAAVDGMQMRGRQQREEAPQPTGEVGSEI